MSRMPDRASSRVPEATSGGTSTDPNDERDLLDLREPLVKFVLCDNRFELPEELDDRDDEPDTTAELADI